MCYPDCANQVEEVTEVEVVEETTTYWSDPASWPMLPDRIPLEGEEVNIPVGLTIIYDIGTSPIFKKVEINGNLSFKYG